MSFLTFFGLFKKFIFKLAALYSLLADVTYGWNPMGNALVMYCSHDNKKYFTGDPLPLSKTDVSVVTMKTVETEYRNKPFTKCLTEKKLADNEKKHPRNEYDISVCITLRIIQAVMQVIFSNINFSLITAHGDFVPIWPKLKKKMLPHRESNPGHRREKPGS